MLGRRPFRAGCHCTPIITRESIGPHEFRNNLSLRKAHAAGVRPSERAGQRARSLSVSVCCDQLEAYLCQGDGARADVAEASTAQTGAVTLIQRFGSALNLLKQP